MQTDNKISPNKTYKTRSGLETRIFMYDNTGPCPIIGAIKHTDGRWQPAVWAEDGRGSYREIELIEVKPRVEAKAWFNVYKHANGTYYIGTSARPSKEVADRNIGFGDRVACVKITIDCEEGEGLTKEELKNRA